MIDIENLVFDTVYNSLHQQYPDADITSGYSEKRAVFPSVVVREVGNVPYQFGNTDDCAENYSRVTVEVEVESDKEGTARSICKELLNAVDDIMQSMKFRRIHKNRPLNVERTIYRQYARYEVIVGKPVVLNPNTQQEKTVFQMYRR